MAAHCQLAGALDHSSEKSSAIWISTECGIQSLVLVACTITPLLVPGAFLNSRSSTKSSKIFLLQIASSLVAVRTPSVTLQMLSGKMASDRFFEKRRSHPLPEVFGLIKALSCASNCPLIMMKNARKQHLIVCIL